YTIPEDTHTDRSGNEYTIPATEVVLEGDIATTSASISEYDAFIDKQGRMFVFWSGEEDGANHIYMVMYAGDNDTETEGNWSEKFSIVSSDDSYYSEIAGALYDGKVVLKANKTMIGSDIRSLMFVKHVPYSDVCIKELELSDKAPRANRSVEVTASVINDGIMPYKETVTVVFTLNGEKIVEKTIDPIIYGSQIHKVSTNIVMPDDIENAEISAYINGQDAVTVKPEFIGIPEFLNQEIATDEDGSKSYKVTLYNSGNIPSEEMLMTAYIGDEVIACETVESIASGESADFEMPLAINDSMYSITNGNGIADVVIRTTDKEENAVDIYSGQAMKVFDAKATELLKKVEDVVFKYDTYTMKKGTHKDIQPEIIGVDEGLHVMWLESSNENVAKISNNIISATSPGKTTLKGVVVPDKQIAVFDAAGNGYMKNVLDTIPENLIKTVTVDIQVNSGSSGGSSGSSVSTKTENNEDGSTTKTATDKKTGTVTEVTTYPDGDVVTVKTEKDGTVTAEVKANSEKDVILPIEPTEDIIVVSFTDENGRTRYTDEFTESDEGIAVTANGNVKISIIQSERTQYTDVHSNNHWATKSVDFVSALGIMKGIDEDKFAPDAHLTRAMLVTMLYRAEGEPEVDVTNSFEDIEDNAWYEKAVLWAKENGIVNGVTETEFSPDSDITREQIATIMHRYAKYKGDNVESGENTNILSYDDSDSISDYAKASLQWANGIGLINGKTESTLNPLDNATRAEAATIFYRFVKANLISTQN
ncbi:MAG: S-layer homology domain-containing protein, partial [Clostridia bacterium]|nr:S-layer homology domain-containing protein [Clostridia bacterium]